MTFLGTISTDDRMAAAYGLIAAEHLAQNDGWISAKEVAAAYGLPEKCMFNAMGDLARAGILRGKRGVGGGFALARPAKEISMLEIIEAVEGPFQNIMEMTLLTKDTPVTANIEKVCEEAISKARDRLQKAKLSRLIR